MKRFIVAIVFGVLGCSGGGTGPIDSGVVTGYGGGCPMTAPPAQGTCTNEGTECEYAGPQEFCGNLFKCESGEYTNEVGYCGTPDYTAGLCATKMSDVPVSQTCATVVQCDYTDGRCSCASTSGKQTWSCTVTPANCPSQRPLLGMNCVPEGQVCDYGACNVENTVQGSPLIFACTSGIWVRGTAQCPK